MSAPIVAVIPHRLGKAEALRRLREGLGRAQAGANYFLRVEPATWDGDRVTFQARALGQTAAASIDVFEHEVRLEVMLPWLLQKIADRILPALRRETTLLLEKK
jgi:hypothetical protein